MWEKVKELKLSFMQYMGKFILIITYTFKNKFKYKVYIMSSIIQPEINNYYEEGFTRKSIKLLRK